MIGVRKAQDRGHFVIDWLDSWHTFSFGDYHDPAFMGFRALRVINEDRLAPGGGFPTHTHKDMEIITYVLDGTLEHKDSLGSIGRIVPGEVQKMSAGTGIRHSEYNASKEQSVHLLQIWIVPDQANLKPSYEQVTIPGAGDGRLQLIGARDAQDGMVSIHQDAALYSARPMAGLPIRHNLAPGRYAFAHVARGKVTINGHALSAGDALALTDEPMVDIAGDAGSDVLLFDLG
jgi:redox-sensitive bicupin YhaK (pirin superfamily)